MPRYSSENSSLWVNPDDEPIVAYGPRESQINQYLEENEDKTLMERPEIKLGYYPPDEQGKRKAFMGRIAAYLPDQTMTTDQLGPHLGHVSHDIDGRGKLIIQANMEMTSDGGRGEARHSIGERAVVLALHYDNHNGQSFSGNFGKDLEYVELMDESKPDLGSSEMIKSNGTIPVDDSMMSQHGSVDMTRRQQYGNPDNKVLAA